ncbi:hypothetical protein N665_0151s0030 [Sinapis alba]|nr:hypothetical protein N665_0151s0030 [Sinapis alba]
MEYFEREIMLNPITAASSSTTGGIIGGRRRVRTLGIPSKCHCGESIIEVISKSRPNPYRRYYRCLYVASLRLENDDHVFKWVDEAFSDKIQQLDYQVRMLEEEFQLLKETIRSQGPKIMPKMIMILGGCVIISVILVLGILMYKVYILNRIPLNLMFRIHLTRSIELHRFRFTIFGCNWTGLIEDRNVWMMCLSSINIHFDYDGHYSKSGDDYEWIPTETHLYAISFRTSSLEQITYSLLKERICRKIGIDPFTKRLNLGYIPLVVEPKRQSYILNDEDVLVYLTLVDKEQRISILHIEDI